MIESFDKVISSMKEKGAFQVKVKESKYDPETVQDWYFTFGCGQPHENHYHVINGTWEEAREKMFHRFGNRWGMMYASAEEAGVKKYKLKELK